MHLQARCNNQFFACSTLFFGDLYIRVVTQVPTSLSKRQKDILEEFNEIESNKPDPVIKSFFEKAKKFWKKS